MQLGNTHFMISEAKKKFSIHSFIQYIGRIADLLLFSILLTASVYLTIRKGSHKIAILFLTLSVSLMIGVIMDRVKCQKQRRTLTERVRKQILTEKLLIMSDSDLKAAFHVKSLKFIRKFQVDQAELISTIAAKPELLICMDACPETKQYIDHYSPSTKFLDAQKAVARLGIVCTEEEVQTRLNNPQNNLKFKHINRALFQLRPNRFFVLGMLLLVLSFLTDHKIYYRLLSTACLIFSVFRGFFDSHKIRNIFRLFLDNMDS